MTVVDIAADIEIGSKPINNTMKKRVYNFRPERLNVITKPPIFALPETRKKAMQRVYLSKVLAFIDLIKQERFIDEPTIMPISCNSKQLISICGSQRNASNLIFFMKQIHLIEDYESNYQYNAYYDKHNVCKRYIYHVSIERDIICYCIDNDIVKRKITNNVKGDINNTIVERFGIDFFDDERVRFSSKLHLMKPTNYSVSNFEEYLTNVQYRNYPKLAYYQTMADEINDTYYSDNAAMSLRFKPSFTWSKGNKAVKKIGIRCTNAYVSAKRSKDDTSDTFRGHYRSDILEANNLDLEYDVKSSVPRITLSLNTGKWVDESEDMYEKIWNTYCNMKYNELTEFGKRERDAVKNLFMRVYFDSDSTLCGHTLRIMTGKLDKNEVTAELRLFKRAVDMALGGKTYDSEIFYHESCIYMEVLKKLLDSGYNVWNCYDAWYAHKKGVTQEQFGVYMKNLVEETANDYITSSDRRYDAAVA